MPVNHELSRAEAAEVLAQIRAQAEGA
jgi:hypothetical protein